MNKINKKNLYKMILELKEKNEKIKSEIRKIQNVKELCKNCIYGNNFGTEDLENQCEYFLLCSFEANDTLLEDLII